MLPLQPPLAAGRRSRFRRVAGGACRGARRRPLRTATGGVRRRRRQSAVIDVNRARTDPDPDRDTRRLAAAMALGPARPGHRAVSSPTTSPTPACSARSPGGVHPGRAPARATCPTSRTGRPSARRRWSPAAPKRRAAGRSASSSGCGTCCRRRRSRAPPTPPARPTGAASRTSSPT